MKILLAFILLCTTALGAYPNEVTWCINNAERYKAQNEVRLWDNARCDFVTETEALEVDWAPKWAESIGQSLFYGLMLNKKPGIILLVKNKAKEMKYVYRCKIVCGKYGIKLYVEFVQEE